MVFENNELLDYIEFKRYVLMTPPPPPPPPPPPHPRHTIDVEHYLRANAITI